MRYFILGLLLLLNFQSFGQCSANDCPCFMKKGDNSFKKKTTLQLLGTI
ncbi:MAG: hypothetical protein GY810_18360 [Aureispira sp.]|nr:hypothetical protein [Aureispira sp.]